VGSFLFPLVPAQASPFLSRFYSGSGDHPVLIIFGLGYQSALRLAAGALGPPLTTFRFPFSNFLIGFDLPFFPSGDDDEISLFLVFFIPVWRRRRFALVAFAFFSPVFFPTLTKLFALSAEKDALCLPLWTVAAYSLRFLFFFSRFDIYPLTSTPAKRHTP